MTANARRLLATSLICGGALMFQILSTRVLSVVMEEQLILFAISFAMLGMAFASSLASLTNSTKTKGVPSYLSWLGVALVVGYIASLYLITKNGAYFNKVAEALVETGGRDLLVHYIRSTFYEKMVVTGLALAAPFFVFGLFLAVLFRSAPPEEYHKYYGADLIGAAIGCVAAVLALNLTGFTGSLAILLAATALGGALFAERRKSTPFAVNLLAMATPIAIMLFANVQSVLEPRPASSMLARNYETIYEVDESWRRWNAHSRIARLTLTSPNEPERNLYAHESGNGWAIVPAFGDISEKSLGRIATLSKPHDVLVIFAGVGNDMVVIDDACGGTCSITGVEINRDMVEHAFSTGSDEFRAFHARENINLIVAEAREFLERETKRYDSILLSWWGAGVSHYVGSSGKLAQYMYTKEAFERMLDRLNPGGSLVLYNGSKAQALAIFSDIFEERGLGPLAKSIAILRERGGEDITQEGFFDLLENMRLVVKPDGFAASDVDAITNFAATAKLELMLFANGAEEAPSIYNRVVAGEDLDEINRTLPNKVAVELSVATDNRPFINELVPRANYFDLGKIFTSSFRNPTWYGTASYLKFNLMLSFAAVVMIMAPLLFKQGPRLSRDNLRFMLYFFALGAGFMFVEIGLIRKLGALLGHPSYSISIVLAVLILSTGLGSLVSAWLARQPWFGIRLVIIALATYNLAFIALYPMAFSMLVALPLALKGVIVALIIFPIGLLLGQFFPLGLRLCGEADTRLTPWAWAVNGTSSTIAAGFAYYLTFPLGFSALLLIGTGLYFLIFLIPRSQVP